MIVETFVSLANNTKICCPWMKNLGLLDKIKEAKNLGFCQGSQENQDIWNLLRLWLSEQWSTHWVDTIEALMVEFADIPEKHPKTKKFNPGKWIKLRFLINRKKFGIFEQAYIDLFSL